MADRSPVWAFVTVGGYKWSDAGDVLSGHMNLSDIKPGVRVVGLSAGGAVEVLSVESTGGDVVNVVFRSPDGGLGQRLFRGEGWTADHPDGARRARSPATTVEDGAPLGGSVSGHPSARRPSWARIGRAEGPSYSHGCSWTSHKGNRMA